MNEKKITYRAMKMSEGKDYLRYIFPCDCQDPECSLVLDFELNEKDKDVFITFYSNLNWSSYWQAETWYERFWVRIKTAIKLLFTGYIEVQDSLIITNKEHIKALKDIINEAENTLYSKKE